MSSTVRRDFIKILTDFPKTVNNFSLKNSIEKPIKRPLKLYSFPMLHVLDCEGNELTDVDCAIIFNSFDAPITTLKLSNNNLTSLSEFQRFKQLRGFNINFQYFRIFIVF